MRIAAIVITVLALLLLLPELSVGQGMGDAIARQNLRGYTHMFIAYGIAWLLVMGWAISIFRRLGRIEEALKD
jgi:uncharacterized membrane protein YbhN (UPF0104 family)